MMDSLASLAGKGLEAFGILVLLGGLLVAFGKSLLNSGKPAGFDRSRALRQDIGKSILLGLEILVAADIVSTVATEPDLRNVLVLGAIVLIRTFLSFSLQVELEGRLPWREPRGP